MQYFSRHKILLLLFCAALVVGFSEKILAHTDPPTADMPYVFEENKGQMDSFILHRAILGSKSLYIEKRGLTWLFQDEDDLKSRSQCKPHGVCSFGPHSHGIHNHAFKIHFEGGNEPARVVSRDTSTDYFNYMIGNDASKWASDVRRYRKVSLENIYDGVDYEIFQTNEGLKYDFIVHSRGDPGQIRMGYEGVDTMYIERERLHVVTSIDTLIEQRPISYQVRNGHRKYVECKFVIEGSTVRFDIGSYDKGRPLIIDPELIFSTYTGSTGDNWGMTATPASNGEMYAAGVIFDPEYPTTIGSFQTFYSLGNERFETDLAITKFSSDGTSLIYSTYMGGRATEVPHSLIENGNGELVVLGTTSSSDFPTTVGAFQNRFAGGSALVGRDDNAINGIPYAQGSDLFVAVLSKDGSRLEGSTFVGGSENDGVNVADGEELATNYGDQLRGEVILDRQNNIYITSTTLSSNFPTSSSAYERNKSGGQDAVLFSLSSNCSNLRFSTYLGGSENESGYSLKLRSDGGIYVVGGTKSSNFPTTAGANQTNSQGGIDGFISLFNADASSLLASTFSGTFANDQIYLCALSFDDELYITGQTEGRYPISTGVYNNPNSGQFIQRMAADLSAVELSTVFGTGSGEIDVSPTAFMIDTCKRIFFSGWGGITNNRGGPLENSTTRGLEITADAFQSVTDGSDFYFMVLERDFTNLIYGSYFGRLDNLTRANDHVDGGTSRFDDKGIIYQAVCAGCGGNDDFPTTPRAWSRVNGTSGGCNLAAIKFDFQISRLEARIDLELDTFGCAPYEAQFVNNSIGAEEYFWDFGDGDTSNQFAPVNTYDSIGTYDVFFVAKSNSSCLDPDTVRLTVETILAEEPNSDSLLVCGEPFIDLSSSREGENPQYTWNVGAETKTFRAFSSGVYAVTATESNCVFVDSFDLTLINPSTRIEDETFCGIDETDLILDERAENVSWEPTGETTTQINVTENNLYVASYSIGACNFVDSAATEFASIPEVDILGRDEACEGESIVLEIENNSPATIETINWSKGERTPSIEVTETGTYTVRVESDSSCTFETEKFVFFIPLLPELSLPDTLLCRDSEYFVDLSAYDVNDSEIIWNDGSQEIQRTFADPGTYSVQITTKCDFINESFTLEFSPFNFDDEPFHIPNVFTPNRDGVNDVFKVEKAREMEILNFNMKVFDRWGNMVFESRDHEFGWNGRFKESSMDPAVFAYVIRLNYFLCEVPNAVKETGDISISR